MSTYNKINPSLESVELDDLDEAEGGSSGSGSITISAEQIEAYNKINLPFESDDSDEEEGGSSGSGSITISAEQFDRWQMACLTQQRRDGLKAFGPVPLTDNPNNELANKSAQENWYSEQPHSHPLLALSQQFSGDDPKLTAIPLDNHDAIVKFPNLRLENQLRKNRNLGLDRSNSATLNR